VAGSGAQGTPAVPAASAAGPAPAGSYNTSVGPRTDGAATAGPPWRAAIAEAIARPNPRRPRPLRAPRTSSGIGAGNPGFVRLGPYGAAMSDAEASERFLSPEGAVAAVGRARSLGRVAQAALKEAYDQGETELVMDACGALDELVNQLNELETRLNALMDHLIQRDQRNAVP